MNRFAYGFNIAGLVDKSMEGKFFSMIEILDFTIHQTISI